MLDSPFMTNQKHQMFLNHEQIQELVNLIVDRFGVGLSGNELSEVICLILEDIAGIENESVQSIQCVIKQIRNSYNAKIKHKY